MSALLMKSSPPRFPGFGVSGRAAFLASPVLLRAERLCPLTDADRVVVAEMMDAPRKVAPYRDIVTAGQRAGGLRVLHSGIACRYIAVSNGQRQITEIILPGDMFTLHAPFSKVADYNVASITPIIYSEVPRARSLAILDEHPRIALAVWQHSVIIEASLHERAANLGRRSAKERLAHLLCELYTRMTMVGLAIGMQCNLPLSQSDLADVLGLSIVHTNRSLQALRAEELVRFERSLLTILKHDRLMESAGFNPDYLSTDLMAGLKFSPMRLAALAARRFEGEA